MLGGRFHIIGSFKVFYALFVSIINHHSFRVSFVNMGSDAESSYSYSGSEDEALSKSITAREKKLVSIYPKAFKNMKISSNEIAKSKVRKNKQKGQSSKKWHCPVSATAVDPPIKSEKRVDSNESVGDAKCSSQKLVGNSLTVSQPPSGATSEQRSGTLASLVEQAQGQVAAQSELINDARRFLEGGSDKDLRASPTKGSTALVVVAVAQWHTDHRG